MLFLGLKIAQAIMTFANSNNITISISNTTIRVGIVVSVFIRGHPLKSHTMCAPGVILLLVFPKVGSSRVILIIIIRTSIQV